LALAACVVVDENDGTALTDSFFRKEIQLWDWWVTVPRISTNTSPWFGLGLVQNVPESYVKQNVWCNSEELDTKTKTTKTKDKDDKDKDNRHQTTVW
jgi:hypothetical protein